MMYRKNRKLLYWLPAIAWMAFIFILSSQTYSQQDIRPWLKQQVPETVAKAKLTDVKVYYAGSEISVHTKGVEGFLEFIIRKGAHVFVFMMLAVLVQWAVWKAWITGKWSYGITFLLSFVYALSDEWHQSFNMERTAKMEDVWIDTIGILLGILLMASLRWASSQYWGAAKD